MKSIIMIHGMWGGGWYWKAYKEFFEDKGFVCYAPTLRYHDTDPETSPPDDLASVSLLDYVQDLEQIINTLDEKPILIGHSMGGLIAQILSERHLAEGCILLTPAAPAGIHCLKFSVMKSFWNIMTTWQFWQKSHRIGYDTAAYAVMNLMSETEREALYKTIVYESGTAIREIGLWLLDPGKAARVDEAKITCPMLVIAGAEDRITPASITRKVAEKYKAVADFKIFENHAHWIIGEPGWEEVAQYTHDWMVQKGLAE